MRCSEIMKTDVQCVSREDTVQKAAQLMRGANIGFLPVCDGQGKVLGTITDRDIAIRVVADGRACDCRIEEVMSNEVVACQPDDDIAMAQELMSSRHKSRLLVIDEDGELAGVISLSDLAESVGEEAASTLREVSAREVRPS
jgi:CBS domain-containing protein